MIHGDVLGERARLSPHRTALVFVETGESISYRDLDARARAWARVFRGPLALSPGDRAGLLSHNRPEYVEAYFGAAKARCPLVPIGTRLTPTEILPIIEDSGLGVLFYDSALGSVVEGLRGVPGLRFVALDAPLHDSDLPLSDLVAAVANDADPERPEPDDLFALLYTSGTTGRPKGVMVPHRMVGWNAYNTVVAWQLGENDVSPLFTPLYHAGGLAAFLTPILLAGGTIVLHAKFDAAEVWHSMAHEKATVVLGVPTIWKLLLECPEIDRVDLSSVRWFISGGAPMPANVLAAYQERGFVMKQGYGMTEVGVNCFAMSEQDSVRKPGSIGRPLPFTEARLVDDEGLEVAGGSAGELCLRGPHVCAGYWRNPEATQAALSADGFFHTGDLAERDDDGFFRIVGRKKDMLISGGVNVYPAEIEAVLLAHPAVREVAVTGVPDPTWGEKAVAFYVPSGDPAAPEDLAAFVEARLAKFKVPRVFVVVESLPVTAYGKVVKGELRARYLEGKAG